jgi:Ca-activated chloride channel homolog
VIFQASKEQPPGQNHFVLIKEFAMQKRSSLLIWLALLLVLCFPGTAQADGIIIPDPPICIDCPPPPLPMSQLEIRYHHVEVTIQDQVAVTRVDQVFYNPNDWQIEGTYIFPLPAGAAVTSFTLWVDGEPVKGQVLDAEEARRTYEDIVSRLLDPALLEYAGQGAVQARIFPIPPQGERRVQLEYTQALVAEQGLVRYVYPLSTEKYSAQPIEDVTVRVEVHSFTPIRAVYSPSHKIDISREAETFIRVGYEASQVLPDQDFVLYYSLGETEALHVLSYRDPGDLEDQDGYFLALIAPPVENSAPPLPKDLVLVLDRSGSMDGEKFVQAQEALRYILRNLNPNDRFNIVAFSTGIETYAQSLRPAEEANEAIAWVNTLSAEGSTDINRALLEAALYNNGDRPLYLIFLTDGLPTEGVVDSQLILENFAGAAPDQLRLFAFGVGYDVDTFLLDSLAQTFSGSSTYVAPGERLDEILSGFYARISTPIMTDLSLDFGSLSVYDLYPQPLPDLFAGSQILLVGRYRQGGVVNLTLRGNVENETRTLEFPEVVFDQDSRTSEERLVALPRLWATRKIGHLLNRVRLSGPDQETIDQIVRLSIRFGIVTPYTSYLVTEPLPLGAAEQERIAGEQFNQMLEMPAAPTSGLEAVQDAAGQGALSKAEGAAELPQEAIGRLKVAGVRTFVLQDGIWVDTTFDPDQMQTLKVPFLSEDYFQLADSRPDLGAALALGGRVIFVDGGIAIEIVAEGETGDALPVQPLLPEEPTPIPITPEPNFTPQADPVETEPKPEPGMLPCVGGVLPLIFLLPVLLAWKRTH